MNEKLASPFNKKLPVTAIRFLIDPRSNSKPQFIVVASGYDWAKGYEGFIGAGTAPPVEINIKKIAPSDFG